jgi:hypothetical protein
MTLGRTSDNKIKIKTDSPKGLRAVECACCNPGPCGGCPDLIGSLPQEAPLAEPPSSIAWQVILGANSCNGETNSISGIIDSPACEFNFFNEKCLVSPTPAQDWLCVYLSGPQNCHELFGYSVSGSVVIGKFKKITEPPNPYDDAYHGIPGRQFLEPDETAECAYWLSIRVATADSQDGGEIFIANRTGITGPILPINIFGTHSIQTLAAVYNVWRPSDAPPQNTFSYKREISSQITFS